MRRVDKELKKVNRTLKQLEECICMPICKEEGIILWNGNGCRAKVECEHLNNYFIKYPEKVGSLCELRSYLEQQKRKCSAYTSS